MKILIWVIIIAVVFALICAVPVISIDAAAVTSSSAIDFIRVALYFIPVNTVTAILAITMGLWIFRIIVALIKTIWDMLPVV